MSDAPAPAAAREGLLDPPYEPVQKPYGRALLALARRRGDVVVLGADLTRQTETDLVRDERPEQFVNVGMAEQNLLGVASGLARAGRCVLVHTFGVFATRRPLEQIALQVAYPALDVKIIGFMPGLSSPGGPSHQAVEDVALMRSLPNMTVLDVADATEVSQVVPLLADRPGPCYLRLKRGEVPRLFGPAHRLDLARAQLLRPGRGERGVDVALVASGMLVATALRAAEVLSRAGVEASVLNVPTIKPLDSRTVLAAAESARAVVSAENHSVVGGLGSAVAETLAEAGLGRPLRRVGVPDTYAQASGAPFLFRRYGLDAAAVVRAAWSALGREGAPPAVAEEGEVLPAGSRAPV